MSLQSGNVFVPTNPLIEHFLTYMRDRDCPHSQFRYCLAQLSPMLAYEAITVVEPPTTKVSVRTPVMDEGTVFDCRQITSQDMALIAIMRAGMPMTAAIQPLFPKAPIGHIGIKRQNGEAVRYYEKLPCRLSERMCMVIDPMIATGATAIEALSFIKEYRGHTENLVFVSLVSAPEGIRRVHAEHPDIPIVTAAVDMGLNEKNYILPGLGDAGDRLFMTLEEERR